MTRTFATARPEHADNAVRIGGPDEVGTPEAAWATAADVSAETHVHYLDAPVVADGGQVVLYAPHIHDVSLMHPHIVDIRYHRGDYFVKQWSRFAGYHWGDLAHSTQLRGVGTYDDVHGERDRAIVTLATGIPEEVVRSINLDYLDPPEVDVEV